MFERPTCNLRAAEGVHLSALLGGRSHPARRNVFSGDEGQELQAQHRIGFAHPIGHPDGRQDAVPVDVRRVRSTFMVIFENLEVRFELLWQISGLRDHRHRTGLVAVTAQMPLILLGRVFNFD